MKKKSLLAAVFIISAALGLAFLGYLKAVPGVENGAENLPRIQISPKDFAFGDINYGDIAEYVFKMKNSGKNSLEINKVATSCACTTAQTSKKEIQPGEEAELLVRYDTGAMGDSAHAKGEQERIIYVRSNDPITPQVEVKIYANVK